jgi:putative endopeptidase
MKKTSVVSACFLILIVFSSAAAQDPAFPYTPSLDLKAMDTTADACLDFYQYACGGWKKNNPIPPDQSSWDVYRKLYEDNLKYLRSILEEAASLQSDRDSVTREIGDFYAACMDEVTIEKRGLAPLESDLNAIAKLTSTKQMAQLVSGLHMTYGGSILFRHGSTQDPDDSNQQIAELDQGGLGLPDRDYYTKDDAKSKEIREGYLRHVQQIFDLIGDTPEIARKNAETVMSLETVLAKASMTRVDRRDPYKIKHKMKVADLSKIAPDFDWVAYYKELRYPHFEILNVAVPDFFRALNAQLKAAPVDAWKTYLRFHVVDSSAPYLSTRFVQENFDFYRKYLRGVEDIQPRWKRCVQYTDHNLGEALGQVYVRKTFPPDVEARTKDMLRRIEDAMRKRIENLDWMSAATKQQALAKLAGIRNKIGHPEKWRDYSSIRITRNDFAGNVDRAAIFESRREIDKVGKPVDRSEWEMTPPTVNAYYDPQMNDINFPAGVLQPPLFDAKLDDAPNYGDTGGTIGHELTHGFDDQGSQYDAKGNLKNWWTKEDRQKFEARTQCVQDQYAKYIVVDDIHINSRLTLGEDVADLGGEILAYAAWQDAEKDVALHPIDGFTPDQRFFIGFAQWACTNERPEDLRVRAVTDSHSPAKYRVNGVILNMPEFAKAFSCERGQPMVKPADQVCKVW